MEFNVKPINIFDFDGTLTTETWPKFWEWAKKFGYSGEERNDNLEKALAEYRESHSGDVLETLFGFLTIYLLITMKLLHMKNLWKEKNILSIILV